MVVYCCGWSPGWSPEEQTDMAKRGNGEGLDPAQRRARTMGGTPHGRHRPERSPRSADGHGEDEGSAARTDEVRPQRRGRRPDACPPRSHRRSVSRRVGTRRAARLGRPRHRGAVPRRDRPATSRRGSVASGCARCRLATSRRCSPTCRGPTPSATAPADPAGPYSPTSRRLARSVLRRALRYAEAEGLVSRNAAAIAHGVKLERAEGRTMSPEQARTFLDSIRGHRLEAAFVVMLSCGLRLSELLGLAWDCVDTDSDTPGARRPPWLEARPGPGTRPRRREDQPITAHHPPSGTGGVCAS